MLRLLDRGKVNVMEERVRKAKENANDKVTLARLLEARPREGKKVTPLNCEELRKAVDLMKTACLPESKDPNCAAHQARTVIKKYTKIYIRKGESSTIELAS
jgi:hypothetical protein